MLHFIDTKNTRSQGTHEAKNPSDHRGDVAMPARWAQQLFSARGPFHSTYTRHGKSILMVFTRKDGIFMGYVSFREDNYRGEIAPVKPIYFRAMAIGVPFRPSEKYVQPSNWIISPKFGMKIHKNI